MSLYSQWQQLIDKQSEKSFDKFWKEYSDTETKIYSDILANPDVAVTGTFDELVQKYEVGEVLFMGFLDGVNTSLKDPLSLEDVEPDTAVSLGVDLERLYFNMQAAQAEHLYTLPVWDTLLDDGKREEITKAYKKSRTVVKEKTPGRNDPCPCGSGKKYKKCCALLH